MTLDDVKQMNFESEMSQIEINNFINEMMKLDKDNFSEIFLYILDEIFSLKTLTEKDIIINNNVKKLFKNDLIKKQLINFYGDIAGIADYGL